MSYVTVKPAFLYTAIKNIREELKEAECYTDEHDWLSDLVELFESLTHPGVAEVFLSVDDLQIAIRYQDD